MTCYKSRCNFRDDEFYLHFNRLNKRKQPKDNGVKTIQEVSYDRSTHWK